MSAETNETPEKSRSHLSINTLQREAIRAAFTDWFCQKVDEAAEADADLSEITEDDVNFALLEDGPVTLSLPQVSLMRHVLLNFGAKTEKSTKELVAKRQNAWHFDAEDIVKRFKLGRAATSLAMALATKDTPEFLLCPDPDELARTPMLEPDALRPPTTLQLPAPES